MEKASAPELEREILGYIREQFSVPAETKISAETHLFRSGLIDSIGVLLLVRFIEDRFQLSIKPEEIILENFQTARDMGNFIQQKRPA